MKHRQHNKTLGQVFLHDKNIVSKIIQEAPISSRVYEIGCGKGILTEALSRHASEVHVIEVDTRWIDWVQKRHLPNITFHAMDILKFTDFQPNAVIVANIPYHITTPIISHLIHLKQHLSSITIMIQKEVAKRIISPHNCKNYGLLSIYCHYHFSIRNGFFVSRNCFTPIPNVDSQVITLTPKPSILSQYDEWLFFLFTKSIFWGRRKTIGTCLKQSPYIYPVQHIDTNRPELRKRGEALSLHELLTLFHTIKHDLSPIHSVDSHGMMLG